MPIWVRTVDKAMTWVIVAMVLTLLSQIGVVYYSVRAEKPDLPKYPEIVIDDPLYVATTAPGTLHTVPVGVVTPLYFGRFVCSDGVTPVTVARLLVDIETEAVVNAMPDVQYTPTQGCKTAIYAVEIRSSINPQSEIYAGIPPGWYRYCPIATYTVTKRRSEVVDYVIGTNGWEPVYKERVYSKQFTKYLPPEIFEVE